MWTHLFSAPNSEYIANASGENFCRPSIFSDHRSIKPGIDPGVDEALLDYIARRKAAFPDSDA